MGGVAARRSERQARVVALRFKTQGIKKNKSYRISELADVVGVSIATVRNWLKSGLQRIDNYRPIMIMGFQALEYLNARKISSKRPMALGEFYCLRCKGPRSPLGAMADYVYQQVIQVGASRLYVAFVSALAIAILASGQPTARLCQGPGC